MLSGYKFGHWVQNNVLSENPKIKTQWKYKHNSPITEYTVCQVRCAIHPHNDCSISLNGYKSIGECGWFIDEATTVIHARFWMRWKSLTRHSHWRWDTTTVKRNLKQGEEVAYFVGSGSLKKVQRLVGNIWESMKEMHQTFQQYIYITHSKSLNRYNHPTDPLELQLTPANCPSVRMERIERGNQERRIRVVVKLSLMFRLGRNDSNSKRTEGR